MPQPELPLDGGPAASPETPPPAPSAVPPDLVAELTSLKTELLAFKAERAAREEEARKQAQQDLLKKGQLEEIARNHEAALKARDEAMNAIMTRARNAELKRSLTQALAGHDLVEGGAEQLLRLWADDFSVEDDGDGFKVRSKADLREPAAVVAERLAGKGYSHFVRAASRGGVASNGSRPAPTQGQGDPQQPLTLAQKIAAQQKALRAKYFPNG